MANRYCNLKGYNKVSDEYGLINTGFNKVDQDVSELQTEVSEIVKGDANAEVGQAHISTIKGKVFETIKDRFEEAEADTLALQADVQNPAPPIPIALSTAAPVASVDLPVNSGVEFEFEAPPLLVNLFGSDGDCEDKNKWGISGVLDTTTKVYGSASIKNGYNWSTYKDLSKYCVDGKHYMLSGWVKTDSTTFRPRLSVPTGNMIIYGNKVNTWHRIGGKFQYNSSVSDKLLYCLLEASDGSSAAWFDGIALYEITVDEYNNSIVDQLLAKYPYVNGIQSMMGLYIQSRVKNFFDKDTALYGRSLTGTGVSAISPISNHSDYIDVRTLSKISISGRTQTQVEFYNLDRVFISGVVGSQTNITVPPTAAYCRFNFAPTDNINNIQLEEGSTTTVYEPHKGSGLLLDGEFGGIVSYRDIIRHKAGKASVLWKKKKYVLQASDIISVANLASVTYAQVIKPIDSIGKGNTTTGWELVTGWTEYTGSTNNVANIGKFSQEANVDNTFFVFALGTTLEQSRTALVGTVIWYVLAQPVEEIIPTPINGLMGYREKTTFSLQTGMFKQTVTPIKGIAGGAEFNYYINSYGNTANIPDNKLAYKVKAIKYVLKNGVPDNSWLRVSTYAYGLDRAYTPITNVDLTAIYEVIAEVLPEEHNNQQAAVTLQLKANLLDSHNAAVEAVNEAQDSIASIAHKVKNCIKFVGCKYRKNTNQSIANTTQTPITWDTAYWDNYSMLTSDKSKFEIKEKGTYLVIAKITFATNATGYRQVQMHVNGTAQEEVILGAISVASVNTYVLFTTEYEFAAGNIIQFVAAHSAGTAIDILSSGQQRSAVSFRKVG